jgi:hypothetical protein
MRIGDSAMGRVTRLRRGIFGPKKIHALHFLWAVLFMLTLNTIVHAQSLIPSTRTVDWSQVGIRGGIPNNPCYQTLSASGGADDSVAIQNALNAAPAGAVICLNPGTYTLHRASVVCPGKTDDGGGSVHEAGLCITDKPNVLRGAGPDKTILNYGDGASIIGLGQLHTITPSFINVTAGATKGSTSLTLASTAGITVNGYITVTQLNPNDPADGQPLVNTSGSEGCSYCAHAQPAKAMDQVDRVVGISGNTISLERPLYFNYTNSPQVFPLSMIENDGLENLRIVGTASSGTSSTFFNIGVMACAHCWVHNVESDMAVDRAHVYLSDVYGSEISGNYFNDGYNHLGGESYGVFPEWRTSETLIANNIIRRARHSTILGGVSGNVIAYNYAIDPFMDQAPDWLSDRQSHEAHTYMNLFEGNVWPNVELDFIHGSASHQTLFRNYVNLTSTNPSTGQPDQTALHAMNVNYYNNYINIAGNVLGNYPTGCSTTNYQIGYNSTANDAIYFLGAYDDGGTPTPNAALSAKVENTMLRGGNWDCVTNGLVWSNNVPSGSLVASYLSQQTMPTSLYLSAKPIWFIPSGAAWPSVDPVASTKVNKTPAQICYESGPKSGGAFTPSSCYNATLPQPPTNLSVTVN